jgi:hypothetical protein
MSMPAAKYWCNTSTLQDLKYFPAYGSRNIDKKKLLEFLDAVEPFINNDKTQIRIEGAHFNLFCTDIELLEDVDDKLHPWIRKIQGPKTSDELTQILSNGHKKHLCDWYPKGRYQYKITLKENIKEQNRAQLLLFLSNHEKNIEISKTTLRWLEGNRYWAQQPFFYVKDEKTLSIVCLAAGDKIKQIDEYIPRNCIVV